MAREFYQNLPADGGYFTTKTFLIMQYIKFQVLPDLVWFFLCLFSSVFDCSLSQCSARWKMKRRYRQSTNPGWTSAKNIVHGTERKFYYVWHLNRINCIFFIVFWIFKRVIYQVAFLYPSNIFSQSATTDSLIISYAFGRCHYGAGLTRPASSGSFEISQ